MRGLYHDAGHSFMLTSGQLAMWSMIAVGFFNSIMFPSIFALGVAELGRLTVNGSAIMNGHCGRGDYSGDPGCDC